jgi:glycosyltransferase involved in cell wall biosynthesis
MLSRRLYYSLKPLLPWRLRMAARRLRARGIRDATTAVWPIDTAAGQAPAGWTGWPEGKKFAFVITHDVEGPEGLAKCRQLAEVEMELGFRSCFNFIPEGGYRVSPELRSWLVAHGFEVGVHDLNHDGKLFLSRRGFAAKADAINRYLREWDAGGFRAGFMLRDLDWYHDLDIEYDASTFDTDPFEPMPDGARTIFPFWVPAPANSHSRTPSHSLRGSRRGYVELPYTLPQDSTLFFVLNETGPILWQRKLDWLVQKGGMALVNVHPDYVCFAGERRKASTYPIDHYITLLHTVAKNFTSQYWHPLPRQLSRWYVASCRKTMDSVRLEVNEADPVPSASSQLKGRRAAVILYSNYPSDPRPRRAAEAMVEAGVEVDLLCLSQSDDDCREETVNGVRVFRHPMKRRRDSKWTYVWQYSRFAWAAFLFLTRRGLGRKLDIVHVHNMPDFLVFAALLPKLRGARIILDLHDPTPELMVTIFQVAPTHWFVGFLRLVERCSIAASDLVLTPNLAFKKLFASRSCAAEKIEIVMNAPRPDVFDPDRFSAGRDGLDQPGEFRVMHHGLIAHRHGVDLLVEAVARLRPSIPGIQLDIYGAETPFLATVLETAARLGVEDIVHHHGAKSQSEIAAAIRRSHVGVVPNRRSVFTEINFPTRLFEYLAMHRPVVAPNTQGIRDYFGPDDMFLFEPDDVADLAAKIRLVHDDAEIVRQCVANGHAVYRRHLWPRQKGQFFSAVASLVRT